ncbi:hypothetical protein HAX54_046336, partial [Datura stramonium]|nr:hypothetical protein [Datura stramonium]
LHRACGRVPPSCCNVGKAEPRACHHAASVSHRTLSRAERLEPRAWNHAAQGPRRASGSTARPVPRASGRAT